ncbi:hypothetical protein C1N58_12550 [Pantoea sp. SGAir0180]
MRQLTASEASNDEMERQRFEVSYSNLMGTPTTVLCNLRTYGGYEYTDGDRLNITWAIWQAALKSKQGEV